MTSWRNKDSVEARVSIAAAGVRSDPLPARPEISKRNVVALSPRKTHCANCALHGQCLPGGLEGDEVARFDRLVGSQRRLRKGDVLFLAGNGFEALYAIRFGSLKTSILAEDGREQVAGYHMVGDIVGMD